MRRIPRLIRLAFLPVFGIALAIVFPLFLVFLDFHSLPLQHLVLNVALALLISLGTTLTFLIGLVLLSELARKWGRTLLAGISLYAINRAVNNLDQTIEATGVGEREGNVVIRLLIGLQNGVAIGTQFRVTNTATGEIWGIIEVIEVQDNSCVCFIFDRINIEFWESLEARMRRDPSPPSGISIFRELPEGLLDFIQGLIRDWRG